MVNYKEERSSLWDVAAASSVAGGIGAALYFNRSGFSTLKSNLQIGGFHSPRVQRNFNLTDRFINTNPSSSVDLSGHIARWKETTTSSLLNNDIKTALYESIMQTKKIDHGSAKHLLETFGGTSDPAVSYQKAVGVLNKHGGDVSVFNRRLMSFGKSSINYSPQRSEDLFATAKVSSGGFMRPAYGPSMQPIEMSQLNEKMLARAQTYRSKLQGILGTGVTFDLRRIKDPVAGNTYMLRGNVSGASVDLPLNNRGLVYGSKGFSTRYITRKGYTKEGQILDYSDTVLAELERIVSEKNGNAKDAVISLNKQFIDNMQQRDSVARKAALWTIPPQFATSGNLAFDTIVRNEVVPIGNIPDVKDMFQKGLFPYVSPGPGGEGVLSTFNVAEELYGPMGRLFPVEARPTQFIRQEWGASSGAKMAALDQRFGGTFGDYFERLNRKIKGEGYEKVIGADPLSSKTYNVPQLLTFYAKPNETGFISRDIDQMISAEEMVISKNASKMMQRERVTQKNVALDEGFLVNRKILKNLKDKQVAEFNGISGFIGIEKGTGKEIWAEKGKSLIGAELTNPDTARVYLRETIDMAPGEYAKFFSEENKFMGTVGDLSGFSERLGLPIEALQSGKLVQRNKFAQISQQIEALSYFASKKIDENKLSVRRRVLAKEFMEDPQEFLRVKEIMSSGQADADLEIQKQLVALSKRFGFKDKEISETFGLMDSVVAARLGIGRQVRDSKGVIGLGKPFIGDLASEGGARRLGSIEQTGMRVLAIKDEQIAADLASRIVGKGEGSAIDMATASMIGQEGFFDKAKSAMFGKKLPSLAEHKIGQGGFFSLGQKVSAFGMSDKIYIPSEKEASRLYMNTIGQEGKYIESEFVSNLNRLKDSLSSGNEESIETAAKNLRNHMFVQSEKQAAARGKVLGSQILTGLGKKYNDDVFRISEESAQNMFGSLMDTIKSGEKRKFLEVELNNLMHGGVSVGTMWRHPTTGPESLQFVKYRVDPDLSGGMIGVPAKKGIFESEGVQKLVDTSSMVGMKGDFDNDKFVLSVISDATITGKKRRELMNAGNAQYNDYLLNHYVMKERIDKYKVADNVANMSLDEALRTGYDKLTTAKTTTGQVNLALQQLKMSVASVAPEKYKPMAALFWHMEEAAIGGKHSTLGANVYRDVVQAVKHKDSGFLADSIRAMLGDAGDLSATLLDEEGNIVKKTLKYDPKEWADIAIDALKVSGEDVGAAKLSSQIAKNASKVDDLGIHEMQNLFNSRRKGFDVSQTLMQNLSGVKMTEAKMASKMRQAKAVVNTTKGFFTKGKGKAAVIGGAVAAAGIMLAAPSYSGSLSYASPETTASRGANVTDEQMAPPEGAGMSIPPARMNQSPSVYSGGDKTVVRTNTRMNMRDYDTMSEGLLRGINADGTQNAYINTRDNRQVLDSYILANKLQERL